MAKILTIDGENIKPLEKAKFNLESDLQDYLEKYPSIIPLDEKPYLQVCFRSMEDPVDYFLWIIVDLKHKHEFIEGLREL